MELMEFRDHIWDNLREMMEYMERTFRGACRQDGMTRLQFRILLELHRHPMTVGAVGKRFGMAHGNVSAMCKKLEREGYLQRTRSTIDERQVVLGLTEQGCDVIRRTARALEARYSPMWESLAPEKLDRILQGMEELNAFLRQMAEIREQEEATQGGPKALMEEEE